MLKSLKLLEEDNRIQLFISGDGLRSELVVKKPLSEEELSSYEELKDFLNSRGITVGIKEEVLERGKKLLQEEGRHLVAEGKRPQRGKDGEVKILFTQELEKKLEEDESGRVDLFDFVKIPEVKEGDLLAELIPPGEGVPGQDIFGKEIPALLGRPAKIRVGKNVELVEEGTKAVAKVAGRPVLIGKTISVLPLFEVDGDVNTSTGNISFIGSIVIRGTIRSGFKVEAEGDIEVWGNVEAAIVQSQGNIMIRGGIFGREKGLVRARGDVKAKVIENATVEAGQDVIVGEAIFHSQISAGRKVVVGGRGLAVGGKIKAGNLVWVKTLGSSMGTITEVMVGIDPTLREEYNFLMGELERVKKQIEEGEKVFRTISERQKVGKGLDPGMIKVLEKLEKTCRLAREKKEFCEARLEELEEIISGGEGKVLVEEKVYPQVRITVGNLTYPVRDEIPYASFYKKDQEVVLGSFEKPRS
ncbi:MAG TPA: FapA family protein [Candidatus Atribacteria bacterium]|nr:FapA family protein [Candidatus Atribacteria bacterium]